MDHQIVCEHVIGAKLLEIKDGWLGESVGLRLDTGKILVIMVDGADSVLAGYSWRVKDGQKSIEEDDVAATTALKGAAITSIDFSEVCYDVHFDNGLLLRANIVDDEISHFWLTADVR